MTSLPPGRTLERPHVCRVGDGQMGRKTFISRVPARRLPAWPLLALPLVAGVGFWTYRTVAAAMQARLEGSLRTILASDVSALGQWLQAQANLGRVMAADPRVRGDVQSLLEVSRRTGGDAS